MLVEPRLQHDGVVHFAVFGGEEEGDVASRGELAQLFQLFIVVVVKLRSVALRKLLKSIRVVAPLLS